MTQITHKGQTLELNEVSGEWMVSTDSYDYKSIDLNKVREYIDKQDKVKFERFEAYLQSHAGIKLVTITSIADSGEIWYSGPDGRGKISPRHASEKMFRKTPANDAVFERYTATKAEHEAARKIQSGIYNEMAAIAKQLVEAK